MELSDLLVELRDEILVLRELNESSIESWLRSRLALDFTWRRIETNQDLRERGVEVAHLLLELLNNAISHQGLKSAMIVEDAKSLSVHFREARFVIDSRGAIAGARLGRVGISERLALLAINLAESEEGFILQWR